MYLAVFGISLISVFFSFRYKKQNLTIIFLLITMGAMLCFRYGQGTDYFAYEWLFQRYARYHTLEEIIRNPLQAHGELGFRIVGTLFAGNYRLFIVLAAAFETVCLGIFLFRYCENRPFSLLMLLPTFWFVYCFSAVRQGIIITGFLAFGIGLIEKKKWMRYVIFILLLAFFFHMTALLFLLIPLTKKLNLRFIVELILPLAFMLGVIIISGVFQQYLEKIPYLGYYFQRAHFSISYFAIAERILTLLAVLVMYRSSRGPFDGVHPWWIKSYVLAVAVYFLLMSNGLISTRFVIGFKALEVMIVPNLLKEKKRFWQAAAAYFILLSGLMFVHNINGSIDQGSYKESVNAVNYPYISVFDKEKIWDYRQEDYYYSLLDK